MPLKFIGRLYLPVLLFTQNVFDMQIHWRSLPGSTTGGIEVPNRSAHHDSSFTANCDGTMHTRM